MSRTKIEWTDATWNPITGCTKISDGCKNCYAERMAKRLQNNPKTKYKYLNGFLPTDNQPDIPLPKVKEGSRIFVCSMGDLFHDDFHNKYKLPAKPFTPLTATEKVYLEMRGHPEYIFQVLTKRPQNMVEFLKNLVYPPKPHIWHGVTVESDKYTSRIAFLKLVPSKIKFISFEPLLSPINGLDLSGIDWVIVGAETGPGARECKSEWVKNILQQCRQQGVPFFFKKFADGTNTIDGEVIREFPKY